MTPSVDTPQGGCLRLYVGRCILFGAADVANLSSCCLFSLSLYFHWTVLVSLRKLGNRRWSSDKKVKNKHWCEFLFFSFLVTPAKQSHLQIFSFFRRFFLTDKLNADFFVLLKEDIKKWSEVKGHRGRIWD